LKEAGSELDRVSGPEPEPDRGQGQDLYRGRTDGQQSRRRRRTWTKTDARCDGAHEYNGPATIVYADMGQQDEGYDQGDSQVVEQGADTLWFEFEVSGEESVIVLLCCKEHRRGAVYI